MTEAEFEYAQDHKHAGIHERDDDGIPFQDAEHALADMSTQGFHSGACRIVRRPVDAWEVAIVEDDRIVGWEPRVDWDQYLVSAATTDPEPPESIDDLAGKFQLVEMGVSSSVDTVREDDDAAPARNHLHPVPDPVAEPGRTITHAQMVEALTTLGLSTRYVQALGLKDDGIWVHSVLPGKSGGRLVGRSGPWIDQAYVEYIEVTDVPQEGA